MADALDRRGFLALAAAAPALWTAHGQEAGRIVRASEPRNLESDFSRLTDSFLTPTERHYVRSHFAAPAIRPDDYRLTVEGPNGWKAALSLAELRALPATTRAATLECAGNGRVYLVPRAKGVAWGQGAVGTAEWSGPTLRSVLERAGWRDATFECAVLEGADQGSVNEDPKTPGVIHYARSLPRAKVLEESTVIALRMNGEPLPVDHGFPARAAVPGWYGMASVKWLSRIVLSEKAVPTYWETFDYTTYERPNGVPVIQPLTTMVVKSQIARPQADEVVKAGESYRVRGLAWAGEADVAKVEMSVDGGKSWQTARLVGEQRPFCWRAWEWDWQVPRETGRVTLMAKATDSAGRSQLMTRDADRLAYLISHVLPVAVNVR